MNQLILAATLIIVSLYAQAAPENFTVKPTAWTQLAMGTNVIMHKSPSSSSSKLVYNFEKMLYMNPYNSTRWASRPPSDPEDYLYMDRESPILSKKNGWFEIHDNGLDENVWVRESSDCIAITPDPIHAGQDGSSNFAWIDSPGDPAGGNYAIFLEPSRWANYGFIYLGRLINGIVVCPFAISYHVDYTNDTITLGDNDDVIFKITEKQMNDDFSPNLSHLSDRILDAIWTGSTKIATPIVIYRSPYGGEYHQAMYTEKKY